METSAVKNKLSVYLPIGIILIAVLALYLGLKAQAHAKTEGIPEKATQIGSWIDSGSKDYTVAELEEADYRRKADEAASRKTKAHLAVSGYRQALCQEFHLLRQDSKFTDVLDCPSF